MPQLDGYALIVGEDGAPHLKSLNDLCNPHTFQFIENHISLKNKRILDIGCGIGILSSQFAAQCLPAGTVTAIDASEDQLNIAKKIAKDANISNINFLNISAINNDQVKEKFDVIYCRFVLHHLQDPADAIKKITSLMHPESILILEEPEDIDSMYCEPPEAAFTAWKELAFKQLEEHKRNFSLGKTLEDILPEHNLKIMQSTTVQPMIDTPHLKQLLWQSIDEIRSLLVVRKFASEKQLDELIQSLKVFAGTSPAKIGYLKYRQVLAKKAS